MLVLLEAARVRHWLAYCTWDCTNSCFFTDTQF